MTQLLVGVDDPIIYPHTVLARSLVNTCHCISRYHESLDVPSAYSFW